MLMQASVIDSAEPADTTQIRELNELPTDVELNLETGIITVSIIAIKNLNIPCSAGFSMSVC